MKKEIEILFELQESIENTRFKLSDLIEVGTKETTDIYYFDPLRKTLQPDQEGRLTASCRLRNKAGVYSLAYKIDHFNADIWSYSDEYEVEVSDFEQMQVFMKKLGLEQLVIVKTKKTILKNDQFEVVLENVDDLGSFIEVEYHASDIENILQAKEKIRQWVAMRDIRIGDEQNAGKPELLLRKKR